MVDNLKRMENETQDQYFYRVCSMKDSLGFTWPQMAEIFNNEFVGKFDKKTTNLLTLVHK